MVSRVPGRLWKRAPPDSLWMWRVERRPPYIRTVMQETNRRTQEEHSPRSRITEFAELRHVRSARRVPFSRPRALRLFHPPPTLFNIISPLPRGRRRGLSTSRQILRDSDRNRMFSFPLARARALSLRGSRTPHRVGITIRSDLWIASCSRDTK